MTKTELDKLRSRYDQESDVGELIAEIDSLLVLVERLSGCMYECWGWIVSVDRALIETTINEAEAKLKELRG